MKVYFDTSNKDNLIVRLGGEEFVHPSKNLTSQYLLPFLQKLLTEKGLTFKDITLIEVNPGPGSFTGIRVGASIAQTLGWSLNVPVNGENISKVQFVKLKYSPSSFD